MVNPQTATATCRLFRSFPLAARRIPLPSRKRPKASSNQIPPSKHTQIFPRKPKRKERKTIPFISSVRESSRERKKKKMPRNGDAEQENVPIAQSSSTTSTTTRTRLRADPLLVVCRGFSVVTCLAAILCIAANVLSAVRSFKHGSDVFDGIFRCYAVFIACFVVLAETEWSYFIRFWKVLEYWAGRGMLQIFVAVMTRAFPDYTGERRELVLFQGISSYLLLACGLIYVVSGALCIGFLKRARQKQEITREQAAKDLEDLERRKEELEQVLLAERV